MKASFGAVGALALFVRRRARLLVLGALVIGVVGSAQAATSTKFYTASVSPSSVGAGTTTNFTVTVTNSSSSTQNLGSANVTVPSLFTGVSSTLSSAPTGKTWTANYVSPDVQFRAASSMDAIAPGESVSASVTATAPCTTGSYQWTSTAKQSNNYSGPPGNNFLLQGLQPVVTVTGGGGVPYSLAFGQQPTRSETNSAITPAVTVRVLDSCGNLATGAGNVTIAMQDNPSGGTLSGTLSRSASTGVATFNDLSIDLSGQNYSLLASYSGLTSVESSSFDVVDQICTSSDAFCEVSNNTHTTTVHTPAPPAGGTMALSLTPDQTGQAFPCGTNIVTVGSLATLDPADFTGTYTATLTYDKSVAPGTGVANFVVCLLKPNGSVVFPVQTCKQKNPQPPCIQDRHRDGVGNLVIVLYLRVGDPTGGTGFG